jgi:hypothetical protein
MTSQRILLWCFAPDLAIEIRSRLQADRSLRSASVQQEVLGFPLAELQLALCHAWHLPELLTDADRRTATRICPGCRT